MTVSDGTNTVVLDEWCSDNLPPGAGPIAAQMFGISESDLANYHICAYLTLDPSMFGQLGKTYQLSVELDGNTYQASTAIVQPTYFDSVWWKPEPSTPNHGFSWVYLTDPPTKGDAYKWEVKRINIGMDGEPIDQNFKVPFSPVFNDQFFNGLAFEFAYENPFAFETETPEEYLGLYPLGDTVVIKFSKLDAQVYEYLEKKYLQIQTAGNPFSTPTNIPNNISGGALGVWAGFSPSYDTLICQP